VFLAIYTVLYIIGGLIAYCGGWASCQKMHTQAAHKALDNALKLATEGQVVECGTSIAKAWADACFTMPSGGKIINTPWEVK
jgi:hypothetical protein